MWLQSLYCSFYPFVFTAVGDYRADHSEHQPTSKFSIHQTCKALKPTNPERHDMQWPRWQTQRACACIKMEFNVNLKRVTDIQFSTCLHCCLNKTVVLCTLIVPEGPCRHISKGSRMEEAVYRDMATYVPMDTKGTYGTEHIKGMV